MCPHTVALLALTTTPYLSWEQPWQYAISLYEGLTQSGSIRLEFHISGDTKITKKYYITCSEHDTTWTQYLVAKGQLQAYLKMKLAHLDLKYKSI